VSNLEVICSIKHRSHHTSRDENPNAKLTSEQVANIRKYDRAGMPSSEIASKFKVSIANVRAILTNNQWREED
jgi:DNA invertase Pin-like site-specific DNA recombinase